MQSSALTARKEANHYLPDREGKNQRLRAAGRGRKASCCEGDTRIKERNQQRRKRGKRASQIGKEKSESLCFAFHLHDWPYRPIGLGAEPVA